MGAGLASLAAACFLVRDGQMKGEHIHILEEGSLPGGACDGIKDNERGFIIRGGREMENHFECLWDLLAAATFAKVFALLAAAFLAVSLLNTLVFFFSVLAFFLAVALSILACRVAWATVSPFPL